MSCPVCNHTMQNLGVAHQRIFWCPRCGTVMSVGTNAPQTISIPKLVGHVRATQEAIADSDDPQAAAWHIEAAYECAGLTRLFEPEPPSSPS